MFKIKKKFQYVMAESYSTDFKKGDIVTCIEESLDNIPKFRNNNGFELYLLASRVKPLESISILLQSKFINLKTI